MPSDDLSLRDARLVNADFTNARLHSVSFDGTKVTDAWFHNADFSGDIEGLVLNGVEVAPLVREELDRRFPQRAKLRATDPLGLAEGWAIIEDVWATTVDRARRLPEEKLHERVDDEWSFVETLRHLVLATDCWLGGMIRQEIHPYHPWGLAGPWLKDPEGLGLDPEAKPGLDAVLAVRRERMDAVKATILNVAPDELGRMCNPPVAHGHPSESESTLQCLHVILDEEWEHCRYANRDLEVLEKQSAP